jgi:hypothetical protein
VARLRVVRVRGRHRAARENASVQGRARVIVTNSSKNFEFLEELVLDDVARGGTTRRSRGGPSEHAVGRRADASRQRAESA